MNAILIVISYVQVLKERVKSRLNIHDKFNEDLTYLIPV